MQAGAVRAEIDLNAIRHNFQLLRERANGHDRVMAVVKADAYGHGAVPVARALADEGAAWLGVARFAEAVALREAGLSLPILVFGHTPTRHAADMARLGVTQTVGAEDYGLALAAEARAAGVCVSVHVKIDTGMGRMGFMPEANHGREPLADAVGRVRDAGGLELSGAYTHFASADGATLDRARAQLGIFKEALAELAAAGIEPPDVHAANSAASIALPGAHFTMIRPGVALYGLAPSPEMDLCGADLRPAMAVKANLSSVRRVGAGFSVSYGHTHVTSAPATLAVVPIGYADGYDRHLSSRGTMLVGGRRAPVVGRVCMDQTMIDVSGLGDVRSGDEVVILGAQGDERVDADDMAETLGTINYEVVSRIMARVPRIYTGGEG